MLKNNQICHAYIQIKCKPDTAQGAKKHFIKYKNFYLAMRD